MLIREFQEKKTVRKIIFSTPVLVLLAILSLWMAYGTVSALITLKNLSQKNKELSAKIEDVKEQRAELEEKTLLLNTEYGIDLEARKEFNLKKPEEEVILFVDE